MMKRYSVLALGAAILVSSCTTTTGAGAYAGSSFGSILGSAIGGLTGGPRGSDVGTIVGMASGAIVGAAMGNAAEKQQNAERSEQLARRNQRIQREKRQTSQDSMYGQYLGDNNNYADTDIDPSQMVDNTNSGDDRIEFSADGQSAPLAAQMPADSTQSVAASALERIDGGRLEIRNARFTDDSGDGILQARETGKLTFEIFNHTGMTWRNIVPTVAEADANRYIYISPSILVEEIAPGQGIRYTATVKADRRIKSEGIRLLVSAVRNGEPVSYVTVVKVPTARK